MDGICLNPQSVIRRMTAFALALAMFVPLAFVPTGAADAGRDGGRAATWIASSTGLSTSSNWYGVVLADVNKDTNLDILAVLESGGGRVYLGNGAGCWTAVASAGLTGAGSDLRVGDIDKDGNPDVIAGSPGSGGGNGVHVYKGNGDGTFSDITSSAGLPAIVTTGNWRGIAIADFNKDGNPDFAVSNGYSGSNGVKCYVGDGTGKFKDNSSGLPTGDRDTAITVADFNKDGNPDIAFCGAPGGAVYLGNGGAGGVMSWTASSTGLPNARYSGVNATDIDNDGSPDIILSAYNAGGGVGLRAYRNVNNAASWTSWSTGLPTSGDYIDASAGDLDKDGYVDILAAGSYGSTYGIHTYYGNGAGSWTETSTGLPTTNQYVGTDIGDFNKDTNLDFVLGGYSGQGVLAYKNGMSAPPQPALSLDAPLGVFNWSGGSPQDIKWTITCGTAPYTVNLSYSTDGGASWPGIIASNLAQAAAGQNTYSWTVAMVNTTSARIRVSVVDSKNMTAINSSSVNSEIDSTPPTIASTTPANGAQNVSNATTVRVRFSENMNKTSAEGAVSITGPGTPVLSTPAWSGNDLTFQSSGIGMSQMYTVTVSTAAKDDTDPGNGMASQFVFTFNTSSAPVPTIALTAPAGGEVWLGGTHQNILWIAASGTPPLNISLDYSTAGAAGPWTGIAANLSNSGSYDWTVPNTPSINCYIRATVTDTGAPPKSSTDVSDANFTIKEAAIPLKLNVTSPNGGEVWDVGSAQNIAWNCTGGNGAVTITIQLSTAGASGPWTNIAANEPNDGTYQWTVPGTIASNCFIKAIAKDSYDPPQSVSDVSNANFTIKGTPQPINVTLTSPNGGEVWDVLTRYDVRWTATGGMGTLSIALEYSTVGASGPWTGIIANEQNDGAYPWNVPNVTGTGCYVRVIATDQDTPAKNNTDMSNAAFTIRVPAPPADTQPPTVQITAPSAGSTLNGTVTISASASDNVGVTRIELFIDGVTVGNFTFSTVTFAWDTKRYPNGAHTIAARAWDAAGNSGNATTVTVTVKNKSTVKPTEPGFLEKNGMLLVVVIVAVVVVAIVAVVMMRRKPPTAQSLPPEGYQQGYAQAPPQGGAPPMQPVQPPTASGGPMPPLQAAPAYAAQAPQPAPASPAEPFAAQPYAAPAPSAPAGPPAPTAVPAPPGPSAPPAPPEPPQ